MEFLSGAAFAIAAVVVCGIFQPFTRTEKKSQKKG